MKILFIIYFLLATNIIAAEYTSETSCKEICKLSIDTLDWHAIEIRKNEEAWTDYYVSYGLNTYVGKIIKEKEKLDLDLLCENIDQEKQNSWSKLYKKKTIDDSVIGVIEYIEATNKCKFLVGKKCNYAVKIYESSFFFKHKCN